MLIPRREIQRYRFSGGVWANGRYTSGPETVTNIRASIQPVATQDLQFLTDEERMSGSYTLFTSDSLQSNDDKAGTVADHVEIDGARYRVVHVEKWNNNLLNHHKAIVAVIV